ncbi:hypothetical protein LVJ94_41320 [Pendulispora rubella]|uniref:Uncharacterized protein n=1 Tax=Pendulispora rubella TaxID=2741070 RepID=A0ABZ2KXW8_9BACT
MATRSSPAGKFVGIQELPIGNDGSMSDGNPSLFSNKLKIVFSRQSGNFSSLQVFIASRLQTIANFSNVQAIGNVNSEAADQTPFISADARELWFSSSRSDLATNKGQLFRALASGEGFGEAKPVEPPNASSTRQEAPVLSADGKTLFYAGDGDGGYDQNDIWEARWDAESTSFKGGLFVAELSSANSRDYPSWVSRDGCRLYVHTTNADGKQTILVGVRPQ